VSSKIQHDLPENRISEEVPDAAIEVHRELGGPGLLESVYEEALVVELRNRGLEVERQVPVPVVYKGAKLASDLRLDLLVDRLVVIECRATSENHPIINAEALTYLRLLKLRLALVTNFGQGRIVEGWHRIVNGLE
jgi:GxxExxY protein